MRRALAQRTRAAAGGVAPSGSNGTTMRVFKGWAVFTLLMTVLLAASFSFLRGDLSGETRRLIDRFDRRTDGERAITLAQLRLSAAPDDPVKMANLANAYLLRIRESRDPTLYSRAADLLDRAIRIRPSDPDVLVSAGSLALARHDFRHALELGSRARLSSPRHPGAYGVLTDALVELGRYQEAVAAAQVMVDLRPDLASLARVSYLRELHGDLDGAIVAMRDAVGAGRPTNEATVWSVVQLGHLLFARGDLTAAEFAYEDALVRKGGYAYALAGKGRVLAARGDLPGAAAAYEDAARRVPSVEIVGALGDVYAAMGDSARAEHQYELVAAMQQLSIANGVRTEIDMALFDADHDRNLARALATAQLEYATRQSIHVAATLAWTEYRLGDVSGALGHAREALRLGTEDPLLLYRAGVIEQAGGNLERAADLLRRSAQLNPRFSILYSEDLAARIRALDWAAP